jgi:O-antigen ligase
MSLTAIAFALAFAAGLGLALFRHPLFGLYTYIAVFYLHPPSRWWGEDLPDLRWSLLAAAVTVIATLGQPVNKERPAWSSTMPARILIAFTIWLWIQNLWALSHEDHLSLSILYTKYVLLYYLIYQLVDTREKITWFLMVHIAGCLYLGWIAFTTTVHGRLEGVGGPGIDEANALAMQMGTGLAVGAMFLLTERGRRWWFCLLAMPFMLNTVIDAQSRGAFLALLGTAVVLWYLKPKARAKLFYGFAVLGAVLLVMLSQRFFWERMGTIAVSAEQDAQVDRSVETRVVLFKAQLRMAGDYPLGAGHRGTGVLSPKYMDAFYLSRSGPEASRQRASHNTLLTALVEQGIPGAIMYAWLWAWSVMQLLKFHRSVSDGNGGVSMELMGLMAGVGGALAMIFAAGIFVDYIKAEVQIWMFALLAIGLQIAERERAAHKVKGSAGPATLAAQAESPVRESLEAQRGIRRDDARPRPKPG